MNFKDIYKDVIQKWPKVINISDGVYSTEDDGFLSNNLTKVWNVVEFEVGDQNEWNALMVWVIFTVLHSKAKSQFKNDDFILSIQAIDIDEVRKRYKDQLRIEGYEKMLESYTE